MVKPDVIVKRSLIKRGVIKSSEIKDPRWTAWIFSLTPLLVGSLAAKVGLSTPSLPTPWRYPEGWPPLQLFWLVWFVIYPCWGYATYLVWQRRHDADVRGVLAFAATSFVAGLFFMPVAALTGDNPGVMTLGDLNGIFAAWLALWVYGIYASRSRWFLLPLATWMPITFALKIWYWRSNS